MTDDLDIRQINASEYEKAFSLHTKMGDKNRDKDLWEWEYRGVEPDRFVFVIGKKKKDIVGTQGMVPVYINIAGKKHFSGKSESSLVDPKMRGKGLFKKLYDEAMDLSEDKRMTCVWGFTTATKVWKDTLGFNVYFEEIKRGLIPLKYGVVKEEYVKNQSGKGGLKSNLIPLGSVIWSGISRAFTRKTFGGKGLRVKDSPSSFGDAHLCAPLPSPKVFRHDRPKRLDMTALGE